MELGWVIDMSIMTGQRACYSATATLRYCQALPSADRGHVRELSGLFTPDAERGKGDATALLRRVSTEADHHGKTLLIVLDDPSFVPFYTPHGFETIQESPIHLMARKPHTESLT
jgi:N-acetylglutamate synthase-like GNAT family acetyltransferase